MGNTSTVDVHKLAADGNWRDLMLELKWNPERINERDENGKTPLHIACDLGHYVLVKHVLNEGIDLDQVSREQLESSCADPLIPIVKLLKQAQGIEETPVDITIKDNEDKSCFIYAVERGHHMIAGLLLDKGANANEANEDKKALLHIACESGYLEMVQLLIRGGADIHARDKLYKTPLYIACENGHADVVALLLEKGVDLNVSAGERSTTPLHAACDNGHEDVALLLLERGANIEARDKLNNTPLHDACANGFHEIVILLINKGADVNAFNYEWSPLHTAIANGHEDIAHMLVAKGADVNSGMGMTNVTPLFVACEVGLQDIALTLVENGADYNVRPKHGMTPMGKACSKGHQEIALMLVDHGADIADVKLNLLLPACYFGYMKVALMLLEKGAEVNSKGADNFTPLIKATENNQIEMARMLLERDADPNGVNIDDVSALHIACFENFEEIALLLVSYGADIHAEAGDDRDTPLERCRTQALREKIQAAAYDAAPTNGENRRLKRSSKRVSKSASFYEKNKAELGAGQKSSFYGVPKSRNEAKGTSNKNNSWLG